MELCYKSGEFGHQDELGIERDPIPDFRQGKPSVFSNSTHSNPSSFLELVSYAMTLSTGIEVYLRTYVRVATSLSVLRNGSTGSVTRIRHCFELWGDKILSTLLRGPSEKNLTSRSGRSGLKYCNAILLMMQMFGSTVHSGIRRPPRSSQQRLC